MTISLVRVDDRVIHGQTMTRWTKTYPVDGILVVGDNIAQDNLRKKVLKAAAGNIKVGIYTVAEAGEAIQKGRDSSKKFFLISDSPQTFAQLVDLGVNFGSKLNIGPMNTRAGATILGRTVAIDQLDYNAFETIIKKNIDISFQLLPDDEGRPWQQMKKKYDELN